MSSAIDREESYRRWKEAHAFTEIVRRNLVLGKGGVFHLGECQREIIKEIDRIKSEFLPSKQEKVECTWAFDGSIWKTSCGRRHGLYAGNLKDNAFNFCPNCGKSIKETLV